LSGSSRYSPLDHARENGTEHRAFRGAIRRFAVRFTSGAHWQLTGHRLGTDRETPTAEVFAGVGFYSRPVAGAKAEAIAARIGDNEHTVIVATRDEDLRRLYRAELDGDGDIAAMFNRSTIVLIKPDGTVEIRSRGGTAHKLVTLEEHQDLRDWIANSMTIVTPSGNSTPGTLDPPPSATGTTVLKAE
jgi:hypothetical protein